MDRRPLLRSSVSWLWMFFQPCMDVADIYMAGLVRRTRVEGRHSKSIDSKVTWKKE